MKSIILLLALSSITLCDNYYHNNTHRNYCLCHDSKVAYVVRDYLECGGVNFGFRYQNTVKQINDAGFKEIKEDYLDGTVLCGKKQEKKVRVCPKLDCEDVVCKENESISS